LSPEQQQLIEDWLRLKDSLCRLSTEEVISIIQTSPDNALIQWVHCVLARGLRFD
jgi:hypothetical protein